MTHHLKTFFAGILALGMLGTASAKADVITYNNGRIIKGLIKDMPDDPDYIHFVTELGETRIPRTRISKIDKESNAQGYIHIGRAFRDKGKLPDALSAFQKALDMEPDSEVARQLLDETQSMVSDKNLLSREKAVRMVDELAGEANVLVEKGEFDNAIDTLKKASDLVPTEEQKQALTLQISDLYLKWAEERKDKFDMMGAEEKLKLSLAANKDNAKTIEQLLIIWEGDPAKRPQAAAIYETVLDRNPDDIALRKKLADLYWNMKQTEDAIHHYLVLFKEDEKLRGTELETRLVEGLDTLHRQKAREKDFDQAIYYYRVLAAIDPNTDPTSVVYYEYLKKASGLAPDNFEGWLELASYAETNGMDSEAITQYRRLLKEEPKAHDQALAGLGRYAQKALGEAQFMFDNGNFQLASTMADRVRTDYGEQIPSVNEASSEIIGRANAKIVQQRRQNKEAATQLVEEGHKFYEQAQAYLQNLFSTERKNMPKLGSDKEEAKRYFRYAIDSYEQALKLMPELGTERNSLVSIRLRESQAYLSRLSGGAPPSRNFGRPMNTPQSSLLPMTR